MSTIEYKGFTIEIVQDEEPFDPRDTDSTVGKMVCFHKRYKLGDKHDYDAGNYFRWSDIEAAIIGDNPGCLILPLRMLDHSGITMSIGSGAYECDPGGWDSGQIGFIFCTAALIQEEWNGDRTLAENYLRGEVEEYDQFLRGDVYNFAIKDSEGNVVNSCCGFFGYDTCLEEAKRVAGEEAA